MTTRMSKKQRPLVTRLRSARILIREWRRSVYDSNVSHDGEATVRNEQIALELDRFDDAYAALGEAIKREAEGT